MCSVHPPDHLIRASFVYSQQDLPTLIFRVGGQEVGVLVISRLSSFVLLRGQKAKASGGQG